MKTLALLSSQSFNLPTSVSFKDCREYATPAHQIGRWSYISFAAALLLAGSPIAQATILTGPEFTASQTVTINGQYLPPILDVNSPPPPPVPISADYNYSGNKLGASEHDFSGVPGITTGVATWSNSIDALGFVRTNSDLKISHAFGNYDSFDDLKVEVSNTVSYYDAISQAELGGFLAYARFETKLTGNLVNNVTYVDPSTGGASKATYQSSVEFSSQLANSRGGADQAFEIAYTDSILSSPGLFGSNVNETSPINVDINFNQQSTLGAVFFSFEYTDNFLVDIEGIDVGSIDIFMKNDLGSTVVTTASWYDQNGALLPFAVKSESGYVYAPNAVVNPVSAPATLALFGIGLLSFGWLRRNKV